MPFLVIRPDEFTWITRPHEPDEPARHVAELSDLAFATPAPTWVVEASDEPAALAQLPEWVAERTDVAEVREVGIS